MPRHQRIGSSTAAPEARSTVAVGELKGRAGDGRPVLRPYDQEEAMEVSDEVVVMNKGRVEQVGTPAEIYDNPATAFVMSFIGPVNVLTNTSKIFQSSGFDSSHSQVFLRPQDVLIERQPNGTTAPATVTRLIHLGWEIQIELTLDDGQVVAAHLTRDRFNELQLEPQERADVKPKDARSFPLYYSIWDSVELNQSDFCFNEST